MLVVMEKTATQKQIEHVVAVVEKKRIHGPADSRR